MDNTGHKLKTLRIRAGMTQGQLAKLLGVSPSTVGMYEQGRRNPDTVMIKKICSIFSVSADSLLGVGETSNEAIDIIKEMSARLRSNREVTLNGLPMSDEDRSKLLNAIEIALGLILSEK